MLISIIIPVYNGEKFIERAIKSCLEQKYHDIEILVIDNMSDDRTAEIVKSLNDKKISYYYLNEKGRSNARNYGLERSKGEYIQFLDADDFLDVDKLWNDVKILNENNEVKFIQSSIIKKYVDKEVVIPPYKTEKLSNHLFLGNTIPINSSIIKKDICKNFPMGIEHCEDWFFWIDSLNGISDNEIVVTDDYIAGTVNIHDENTGKEVLKMYTYAFYVRLYFINRRLDLANEFKRYILLIIDALRYIVMGEKNDLIESLLEKNKMLRSFSKIGNIKIINLFLKKIFIRELNQDSYVV